MNVNFDRQSVLESVGGDQDRAIDMLLGMSDPNYVPQEPPTVVQVHCILSEETHYLT